MSCLSSFSHESIYSTPARNELSFSANGLLTKNVANPYKKDLKYILSI